MSTYEIRDDGVYSNGNRVSAPHGWLVTIGFGELIRQATAEEANEYSLRGFVLPSDYSGNARVDSEERVCS